MKYFLYIVLNFPLLLNAQNDWTFLQKAGEGRTFCRCVLYKGDTVDDRLSAPMTRLGFDSVRFLVREKHLKKTVLKMPIFDTITLKIPVNFTTRMTSIPDEYTIINKRTDLTSSLGEWQLRTNVPKESLAVDPSDCIVWTKAPLVEKQAFIPTLTLQSTAHQIRVERSDSIEIKRIVQRSAVVFKEEEVPPKYKIVLIPKVANSVWSEWREVFICGRSGNRDYDSNPKLVEEIQLALQARGYYIGKINNKMDRRTKKALIKFQMDKGMPSGWIETFKALGL